MRYTALTLVVAGLCASSAVWANNHYPLEFADFFEERPETIEVVVAGETRSQTIDGLVSYETFRLPPHSKNVSALKNYLHNLRLTPAAVDAIVATLTQGVDANPGCKGVLSACIPTDERGEAEFVFDFDARQLKVFVSSDMLGNQSGDAEYYSALRANNALVNWSDLYFYVDGEGDDSVSWSNNSTLGLPMGFLSLDTQYQHSERQWDIYQAVYDVEKGAHRGIVGYQGRNATAFNTTDFLNYGANYSGFGVSVGSSQNLLKGQAQAQKRIYYFAPQPAQLEVYQGDRLLFTKVVAEGQQSLGYDELPAGVYSLTLVLKQGGQDIMREQRQVVNTAQFALPVKGWDYRADAGLLDDIDTPTLTTSRSSSQRAYGRASLAYRPSETWLFALGSTSNGDDTFLQTGGYWVYGGSVNAQYNLGVFMSGAQSHYGQVSLGHFTSSVRYIDTGPDTSTLSHLLYGDVSSTDWSLGVSGDVLGGTGYASYFNYQASGSQSDNVSLSWSRDVLGGRMSVNTTYSMYGNQQSAWTTTLAWSHSLGDNLSGRAGLYFDRDGFGYNQNSMTYQRSGDDGYMATTAGVKLGGDGESNAEWSGNVSGHRDALGYSAYAYVNTDGQRSLSGNLSGTQIVSADGGAMTYEQGRAFVGIQPEMAEPTDTPISMTYSMLKDGDYWYQDEASAEHPTVVKLDPYSDMAFTLDADADNVDIEDNQYQHFVLPGSYYQLNSQVIPLSSQVFLLNDMFGEPISSVRCLGDGCKSVEGLSDDGIYRVNFRKNMPFKLVSAKRLCVYNPELMGETYVQAYCLPGLDEVDGNIVWEDKLDSIAQTDTDRALLYIGKYESTREAETILGRLQEVGLAPKSIEVADSLYVYVRYRKEYTLAQRSLLESLEAYVILDSIKPNQLFSVR
jgi:hypothetical protein